MPEPSRITMSASQAHEKISDDVRNAIYEALLANKSIPNIENTIKHAMQTSGFLDNLKAYIKHLFRNEGVTSMKELMEKVEVKVLHDTQAAKIKDTTNGVNGVNGHSNESDEFNLALPNTVNKEGTRIVVKELEKVVDITVDEE